MKLLRGTTVRRRPAWLSSAALVVSALLLLPSAAAAPAALDPLDPAAPGSPDPFGDPDQGPQCVSIPIGTLPPGFVSPTGLPEMTGCTIVRAASGVTGTPSRTNYTGVATAGVQGAPHLGQWIRIPPSISVAVVPIHLNSYQPTLGDDPPGTKAGYTFYPQVWFVSDDRKRVGEMPPFTVKSLAFGAIPVQVTVHITQPRNSNGSIEPLKVKQANPQNFNGVGVGNDGTPNTQLVRNAKGGGRVSVRLSDAMVDGVPLDIGGTCRTSSFADLQLQGDGYLAQANDQRLPVPAGKYNGARGGVLHGTLNIPAFTGCRAQSGDDVSRLLTNLISGPGNPITIAQTAAQVVCYPQYQTAQCQSTLANIPYPADLPKPTAAPTG